VVPIECSDGDWSGNETIRVVKQLERSIFAALRRCVFIMCVHVYVSMTINFDQFALSSSFCLSVSGKDVFAKSCCLTNIHLTCGLQRANAVPDLNFFTMGKKNSGRFRVGLTKSNIRSNSRPSLHPKGNCLLKGIPKT
jgi:hypothetical protein